MSRQLIHIVGPAGGAREWLAMALMHALQSTGVSGSLLDVIESDAFDNAALREHAGLGRVALVLADAQNPRHIDLRGDDLCITLVLSTDALAPELDWLTGQPIGRPVGHAV